MIYHFLVNYFLFVFLIGFFYFTGSLLLFYSRPGFQNWFFDASIRLFFGTVLATTVYAVFKTDFITFLTGMFVFLSVILYQLADQKTIPPPARSKPDIRKILLVVLASFISYSLFYWINADFTGEHLGKIIAPGGDMAEYVRISYYMDKTGYENTFGLYNLLESGYNGFHMYHYYELWLNAMIAEVFHLNHSVALLTLTSPLLYFTVLMCFFMVIEAVSTSITFNPFYVLLVGLALMYCSAPAGIEKLFFPNINLYSNYSAGSYVIKYSYYFILILFTSFFYLKGKNVLAYTMLTGIIFFTTSPLPLFFILTPAVLLANRFLNYFSREELKRLIVFLIVLFGINVLLLYVLPPPAITVDGTDMSSVFEMIDLRNFGYFRRIFNIVAGQSIFYGILFTPYLFLFFIDRYLQKKAFKESIRIYFSREFIFLLMVFYSGLLAWGVLHKNVEGVQLFFNFFICFVDIFLAVCVVKLLQRENSYSRTAVLFLFAITSLVNLREILTLPVVAEHSKSYLSAIHKEISDKPDQQVGYIQYHLYGDPFFSPHFYSLGSELLTVQDGFYSIGLNDLEGIPNTVYKGIDIDRYHKALKNSILQNFRNAHPALSLTNLKLQFIKKYKIGMVIVPKNEVIDPAIEALSKRVLTDPKSGERFYVLDLTKIL